MKHDTVNEIEAMILEKPHNVVSPLGCNKSCKKYYCIQNAVTV